MIYFDTSALVKLVFEEDESSALAEWIADRVDLPKVSSELSVVELLRTCRRVDETALNSATLLLDGLDLLPVSNFIVQQAAAIVPSEIRSLDAIHLASALTIGDHLVAFVAYDHRLSSAAQQAGMVIATPE